MKKIISFVLVALMMFSIISVGALAVDADCNHSYVYQSTVPVSCSGMGYDLYVCEYCGGYEQRNIVQPLGHSDNDYDGKCDNCDEYLITTFFKKCVNLLLNFLKYVLGIG